MWSNRTRYATVALLAVVLAAGGLAAAGTVAADGHEKDEAPTYNTSAGEVRFDIRLPDRTDHYPGDHPVHSEQDGYNASITYFARVEGPMRGQGADDGLYLDYLELDTTGFVDYSECSTARNTAEFGIDRDSDNDGFRSDESLLEHRRETNLERDGLEVVFFDWEDFSGDPPYLGPSDTVVARQGKGSRDGPCLKMAEEPGWYQVQAYANGTVATECGDRPQDDSRESAECESDDPEPIGMNLNSNYVYVCECDDEGEAREKLGPPPNEQSSAEAGSTDDESDEGRTPTPTATPAATATPTMTATATPASTPTATPARSDDSSDAGGGDGDGSDEGNDVGDDGDDAAGDGRTTPTRQDGGDRPADRPTPTIGEGPGFTPVAALVGLLAAALLVYRRR